MNLVFQIKNEIDAMTAQVFRHETTRQSVSYRVSLKDEDSGLTLPYQRVFDTLPPAVAYARRIAGCPPVVA